MSKLDFAVGELKCGRLPWFAPMVWAVIALAVLGIACFALGFGLGMEIEASVQESMARKS